MDEMTPICQKKDLPLGSSTTCRLESLEPLIMCGGGVRNILVLSLVARCIETIYVCIWLMFAFISIVVTVCGSVGMFVV